MLYTLRYVVHAVMQKGMNDLTSVNDNSVCLSLQVPVSLLLFSETLPSEGECGMFVHVIVIYNQEGF